MPSILYCQVCSENWSNHTKSMIQACEKQFKDELTLEPFSIYSGNILFICADGDDNFHE